MRSTDKAKGGFKKALMIILGLSAFFIVERMSYQDELNYYEVSE